MAILPILLKKIIYFRNCEIGPSLTNAPSAFLARSPKYHLIWLEFFCNLVFRFCSRINQGINPQPSYLDRFLPSFWACTHLEAPFWAFMKEQGMIRAPISKFLVFIFVIIKSFLINQKSWLLLLVGTGVLLVYRVCLLCLQFLVLVFLSLCTDCIFFV